MHTRVATARLTRHISTPAASCRCQSSGVTIAVSWAVAGLLVDSTCYALIRIAHFVQRQEQQFTPDGSWLCRSRLLKLLTSQHQEVSALPRCIAHAQSGSLQLCSYGTLIPSPLSTLFAAACSSRARHAHAQATEGQHFRHPAGAEPYREVLCRCT